MPALAKGAKVLVTGANGFIAATTCRILVEHGFQVVGIVRTAPKGEWLRNKLGNAFSYFVVPDIEKSDAFDDAIKENQDVSGVLHTASPISMDNLDPQHTINPAVSGTVGILGSILRYGPNVQRVVITSSAASILEPKDGPYTFTEKDWNTYSVPYVEREGSKAVGIHVYRASKLLAERAAWGFVEKNKSNINFDLVTLQPVLVYGPLEQEPTKDINSLNVTSLQIYQNLTSPPPESATKGSFSLNIVDVRDTGLAHVLALERPEAGGERFAISAGPFYWDELRDAATKAGVKGIAPSTLLDNFSPEVTVDGSKATRVLGLQYRNKYETAVEAIKSIYEVYPDAIPKA